MGIGIASSACCCGNQVGFDIITWQSLFNCFGADAQAVELIAFDITLLDECTLVFAGNYTGCNNAIRFPIAFWNALREWVEGGGKLFIGGEHSGNFDPDDDPHSTHLHSACLKDLPTLQDFLLFIGSTIEYIGGDLIARQPLVAEVTDFYTPLFGLASISLGVALSENRFGEVSPGEGSPVWVCEDTTYTDQIFGPIPVRTELGQKTVMVAERIGDGIVFLTGDSNHFNADANNSNFCDFVRRLLDFEVKDML